MEHKLHATQELHFSNQEQDIQEYYSTYSRSNTPQSQEPSETSLSQSPNEIDLRKEEHHQLPQPQYRRLEHIVEQQSTKQHKEPTSGKMQQTGNNKQQGERSKGTANEKYQGRERPTFKPIPVPPIDPHIYSEPQLRSIWGKITELQKIVDASSPEQLQRKTLSIFEQTEQYFSRFL